MNTQTHNKTVTPFSDAVLLGFAKRDLDQLWAARMVADDLADRIEADVAPSRMRKNAPAV